MKNVIITGSNGMIGSLVLESCLQHQEIGKVTAITRRSLNIQHEKLVEVIHDDFLDYTKVEEHFRNQDLCFYCIGVYTGQVPTDEFNKITIDFTKVFGDVLKKNSPSSVFCFLSGAGADSTEKSRILFAKSKGIAENYLLNLKFQATYIFRPGYIYPTIPRKEPNFTYQLMRYLYSPVSKIYPNIGLTSKQLSDKMLQVGLYGSHKTIFENIDIRSQSVEV
jgi:nucleoside-diphosphate-sugar epimerase